MTAPVHPDPAALSRQLQQVAFALGHTLTLDVEIEPLRIIQDLLATSAGVQQALREIAKAAEQAGLDDVTTHLRTALNRETQVFMALRGAIKVLEPQAAG